MSLGLEGTVAVVTGGGRNIGRQVCLTLAGHGCDVAVIVRRDLDAAQAVAAEIVALGRRAVPIVADVGDPAAVAAMISRVNAELGPVGVLVNCAALLHHVRFLELSDTAWRDLLRVIIEGPMHTSRAVIPGMVAMGGGSIVNVSGTVVLTGSWPHLAAAKSAVHGLTRGLAREFGPSGIRVNIVVPSTVGTVRAVPQDPARAAAELARTPLGRVGTTREIADVVAFLAGNMSSFVTGQSIHANGGQFMP